MKRRAKKKYSNLVRAALQLELNKGYVIKAMNTLAMATVRYGTAIINWTIEDLEDPDGKTKLLNY